MYSVSIKTDKNWEQLLRALERKDDSLMREMRISMLQSVQDVRTASLRSGKIPFRTGTLRRSLTTAVTGTTLDTLQGDMGSNLPYAAIHEYGGSYTYTRSVAFGRTVKPFTYTATYKARRYLRDPFRETLPRIRENFSRGLSRVVSFR